MVKLFRFVLLPIVLFIFLALVFSIVLSSAFKHPSLRNSQPTKRFGEQYNRIDKPHVPQKNQIKMQMPMPRFMYGTAWKKSRTKELVELAVKSGFRGIDTACQPKHYFEPGVGEALESLYVQGVVTREDIFLQTKFTSLSGQDPNNIPYTKEASLPDQVRQSFNVSTVNLRTHYVNSLVLHGPMQRFSDTMLVWRAMEEIHTSGGALQLGISNTYDIRVLRQLYSEATIKPTVLQNRFYADSGYDVEIRAFCKEHGIAYQSFWTLTANPHIIKSGEMKRLVKKYGRTPEQVFFMFVQAMGITPLTGSTSALHIEQDLDTVSVEMEAADVDLLNHLLLG